MTYGSDYEVNAKIIPFRTSKVSENKVDQEINTETIFNLETLNHESVKQT